MKSNNCLSNHVSNLSLSSFIRNLFPSNLVAAAFRSVSAGTSLFTTPHLFYRFLLFFFFLLLLSFCFSPWPPVWIVHQNLFHQPRRCHSMFIYWLRRWEPLNEEPFRIDTGCSPLLAQMPLFLVLYQPLPWRDHSIPTSLATHLASLLLNMAHSSS